MKLDELERLYRSVIQTSIKTDQKAETKLN